MRRSLIAAAVLLVFAVGGLCMAARRVSLAEDAIEIQEKIVYGERTALDGLLLDCVTGVGSGGYQEVKLLWETHCTFTGGFASETAFTFAQEGIRWERSFYTEGFSLCLFSDSYGWSGTSLESVFESGSQYIFGMADVAELEQSSDPDSAWMELKTYFEQGLLLGPALDVAARAQPGETHQETVWLKDYYDYYPIYVSYYLPAFWEDEYSFLKAQLFVNDYFRIPVWEDDKVEVTIARDIDGTLVSVEMNPDDSYLWLETYSITLEDGIYFLPVCYANGDKQLAIETADGYGIYSLPVREDGELWLDRLDQMSLVYEIDPERADVLCLEVTEDRQKLLLVTAEDGKAVLTILDRADTDAVQRIELFDIVETEDRYVGFQALWVYPDYLVALASDGTLLLLAEDSAGQYQVRIRSSLEGIENWEALLYRYYYYYRENDNPPMAYDGERLAVASFLDWFGSEDFWVAVYDETGLLCVGEYANSQSRDFTDYNNCRPTGNKPLQLSWGDE